MEFLRDQKIISYNKKLFFYIKTANSEEEARKHVEDLKETEEKSGLQISFAKTEIMTDVYKRQPTRW